MLALDFDGVLCDGMKEYFQTAWRVYCKFWQPEDSTPPPGLAERFYRTRPVVETGWEMPLLLRALLLDTPETAILQDWATIAPQLAAQEGLSATNLAAAVDAVRDRWIAADVNSWLAEQEFYPGIIEQLRAWLATSMQVVIISTKEGRFIQALLRQHHVDFTKLQIFGKEVQRPKAQTLRELSTQVGSTETLWFVEDRLKTLQTIRKEPDLAAVKLFLADWGYNTQAERELAAHDSTIHLLSLPQFGQALAAWLP